MNNLKGYNFRVDLEKGGGYITSDERELDNIWRTQSPYQYSKHNNGGDVGVYLSGQRDNHGLTGGIVVAENEESAKMMLKDYLVNRSKSQYYIPMDHENMSGRDIDREAHSLEVKNIMGESTINKILEELKTQTQMVIKESLLKESETYFSDKQRDELASKGFALPDGSYPIRNKQDVEDAIKAFGLGKDPKSEIKAHIIKRAKALDAEYLIPDKWKVGGTGVVESLTEEAEAEDEMTPEREAIKKELYRLFTEARLNKNDVIVNQKITKIIDKLAKAWSVETYVIEDELKLGTQIEKEHNDDIQFKKIIALQHINEKLTYYTDSKPENWAEKEIEAENGGKPVNESIKRLFKNKDRIVSLF